ncbi:uncharacterized protein [Paramormyrops kingsleyae]|uniref:uncharacterized protein n=1 Tax=Paramormyrops kingsleyae TaxID=1676925 RepID=UPI003B974D46
MKKPSWLRKNWLWVAGAAFVGIHFGTWLMQQAMKSSARSEKVIQKRSLDE